MNVSIFGLGYVGLTTALFIDAAKIGMTIGYDVNPKRIGDIWSREMPFYEPGLEHLFEKTTMSATTQANSALNDIVDMVIVCVGTPSDRDGGIDLSYVEDVMATIGERIARRGHKIVIMLKSTVTPGTSRKCIEILENTSGKKHGDDFGFLMCPEFLREGSALKDMALPDMIVIGHEHDWEIEFAKGFFMELYLSFGSMLSFEITSAFFPCTYENAEFIKYANNGFLATKISYMNELANIVELVPGADIKVIENAIRRDHRINGRFLAAGVGFGGSCFSKDVRALTEFSDDRGHAPTFLEEVLAVNKTQRDWVDGMLNREFGNYRGKRIAILGLAFKPGTDDVRDAPAIDICKLLHARGAELIVHDPKAMENFKKAVSFSSSCRFALNRMDAIAGADCAVILTDWPEYKEITAERFKSLLKHPIVIDGRRIYDPHEFQRAGITYYGVGYGASGAPAS